MFAEFGQARPGAGHSRFDIGQGLPLSVDICGAACANFGVLVRIRASSALFATTFRETRAPDLRPISQGQTCEGPLELTTRLPHASCGEVGGCGGAHRTMPSLPRSSAERAPPSAHTPSREHRAPL